tara:strand:+ start:10361 stop:11578 length:1218 start_codon:yes stop_codon:yes gene_type:complete
MNTKTYSRNKSQSMRMARLKGTIEKVYLRQDNILIITAGLLIGFGIVMVASASLHLGAREGEIMRYVDKHLFALGLGIILAISAYFTPISWWEKNSGWVYFIGLGLLIIVFIPGLGREANGAIRWVAVGSLSLQTSEFMKLFIVIYMAGYVVRRQLEVTNTIWGFIKPLILLLAACFLIMLQPDFGTTVVILATAFGMLFLAGAPLWQFGLLLGLAGSSLAALIYFSPYRMARVTSFLNPWEQAQDAGYQLSQALIAFGRGEWTGVGLGNGIQKQFYLPEAHTDFVMAVIGEELGLLGTIAIIFLFSIFVWRAFAIGYTAEKYGRKYAAFIAYGLGLWIGMQAFINIGVNMGILPTKGLTLPFISYGSNSLIVCCLATGMLMRIHSENCQSSGQYSKEGSSWQRA